MNRRWLSGGIREVYLFLFIPPLPFLFYFSFSTPCYIWGAVFLKGKGATGYVTRGLKDGPSRHPEKVYPGGEGHERGGRGEGRGQLRQRLYGGSKFRSLPSSLCLIPISTRPLSVYNFHLSLSTDPPFSLPSPSLVSVYPPGGEAGAATLPSSFSSHFQALHGGLALSLKPQKHSRLLLP